MEKVVYNGRAHLGCGTLILIALIVWIFSGTRDNKKLRHELEQMNAKLDRLEQKLNALSPAAAPAAPAAR